MDAWKPPHFTKGDQVTNPARPRWGSGVVLDFFPVGGLPMGDGTVLIYLPKCVGQVLSVKFEDGRTRTIVTSSTPLHKSE